MLFLVKIIKYIYAYIYACPELQQYIDASDLVSPSKN